MLSALPILQSPHPELTLLLSYFSWPKVSYLMRTGPPPPLCLHLWKSVDNLLRDSLNWILGTNISDCSLLHAQISVLQGGLGLSSTHKQCSAAFLSSVFGSQLLVEQLALNLDFSVVSTAKSQWPAWEGGVVDWGVVDWGGGFRSQAEGVEAENWHELAQGSKWQALAQFCSVLFEHAGT